MPPERQPSVWTLITLGGTNVACLVVGLGGGYLLDRRFHTLPAFVLVGLALGVVCGVVISYVRIRSFLKGE